MPVLGRIVFACLLCFGTVCLAAEPQECPGLLKQVPPDTNQRPAALDHLRLATEQLQAAGLKTEAEKLRALSLQIKQRIRQKQSELETQAKQLQQLVGTPAQILCRCCILELTPDAAEEFAVAAKPVKQVQSGVAIYSNAESVFGKLKREGKVKLVHASPQIVTRPGKPATFKSGGEFPIPVPADDRQSSVEWREFGIICKVEPDLLENGKVLLRFSPEISEQDFANAVQVNGTTVPGLTVRRVNTRAEMNLGETLVVKTVSNTKDQAETVTLYMVTPVNFEE